MSGEDFVLGQSALLAFREGKTLREMLGVLYTLRARVVLGLHEDWLKCIAAHRGQSREMPDVRDPVFQDVLHAVDAIYAGQKRDNTTNGALNYVRGHSSPLDWAWPLEGQVQVCSTVDGLMFYKPIPVIGKEE